jgi:hypothetical protein
MTEKDILSSIDIRLMHIQDSIKQTEKYKSLYKAQKKAIREQRDKINQLTKTIQHLEDELYMKKEY